MLILTTAYKREFILRVVIMLLISISIFAQSQSDFSRWLSEHIESLKEDYPREFLNKTFDGVKYNPDIIKYDRRQPEFVRSMGEYLRLYLKEDRIIRARDQYQNLRPLLNSIQRDHKVEGKYLVSFWALETDLSRHTGKIDLVEALCTLSFDGRRSSFFKRELNELLKILYNEKIVYPDSRILGSWAGAMGSTQFMPSNINAYAIDYDRDGRINMWSNTSDFLGSSANFLKQVGYRNNELWAVEVELDQDFDYDLSGLYHKKSVSFWLRNGVKFKQDVSIREQVSSIYIPQGINGPKFLVLNNFFRTYRWNNSSKYALAIGIMSDLISGRADYFDSFNLEEETFLTFDLSKDIQRKLNELGFNVGKVDGIIGPKTFRGLQMFQKSLGLIADGYLSKELAQTLLNY